MNGFESGIERAVSARRLWAGGIATACVAALAAIVGILSARGLGHVNVLAPKGEGVWGGANTVTYALSAAAAALGATALLHLLLLTAPRARLFFGWIMVLLTAIAIVVPLSLTVDFSARLATAIINLVIGLAITMTLSGVATAAARKIEPKQDPESDWQSLPILPEEFPQR